MTQNKKERYAVNPLARNPLNSFHYPEWPHTQTKRGDYYIYLRKRVIYI
jgi:hypothetical protein